MKKCMFIGRSTIDLMSFVEKMPNFDGKAVALADFIGGGGPALNGAVTCQALGTKSVFYSSLGKSDHLYKEIIESDLRVSKPIEQQIRQIFDQYDFTIYEKTENVQQITPELMGILCEQLLDNRKNTGTFYTPPAIVNYMCQSGLISYLCNQIPDLKYDQLAQFIKSGSVDSLQPYAKQIDQSLAQLTCIDPAIGSGAFAIGLLDAITQARSNLVNAGYIQQSNPTYNYKKQAIEQTIHGCDLDPIAIEITKIRLWLSLIMEQRLSDPLPKLCYNLQQGNSLLNQPTGKFDIVIANPPYVSYGLRGVEKMDSKLRTYLKENFTNSAEYKISLYALFMELGFRLGSEQSILVYIVPDSFLLGKYFSKIRKYILQNCFIDTLMLIKSDVFATASLGQSVVYVFNKNKQIQSQTQVVCINNINELNNNSGLKHRYSQKYFENQPFKRFRLLFNRTDYNLVNKTEENSCPLLDFLQIRSGLIAKHGQNSIKSDHKINQHWGKGIFSGSSITPFMVNYKNQWLCFKPEIIKSGGIKTVQYFKPKILIRQTGDTIIAGYDDQNLLATNNVHVANLKSDHLSPLYILALLNSKLLNYYYHKTSLEQGRPMAQIDIDVLKQLPIKSIDVIEQQPLIDLVKRIITSPNNHEFIDQLNQLIYQLYGLNNGEIETVEQHFN